jgi:NADPH2 dehydrogenase
MSGKNPIPGYSYLVSQLAQQFPNLAYVHVVEPRSDDLYDASSGASNDFIREIWSPRTLISAGGYERDTAIEVAEEKGDVIAFSRHYIANVSCSYPLWNVVETDWVYFQPDLPYRLLHNIALAKGDRSTYYVYGSPDPKGYTDYPFAVPISERIVSDA